MERAGDRAISNGLLTVPWTLSILAVTEIRPSLHEVWLLWLFLDLLGTYLPYCCTSLTFPFHPLRCCALLTSCRGQRLQLSHVLSVPFPLTPACPDVSEPQYWLFRERKPICFPTSLHSLFFFKAHTVYPSSKKGWGGLVMDRGVDGSVPSFPQDY